MAKASTRKLQGYIKAATAQGTAGAAGAGKGRRSSTSGGTGLPATVWDLAATHGQAVQVFGMNSFDKANVNFALPFVARFAVEDPIFENTIIKQSVDAFFSKFEGSAVRATEGRAQRPVKAEVQAQLKAKLDMLMPGGSMLDQADTTDKTLKSHMAMT
eukprot:4517612-Alexandrium_andersonii.AAC.1